MSLRPYHLPELDAGCLNAVLTERGGILLQDVLPADEVQNDFEQLAFFFSSPDEFRELAYDPATRLGYTPPSVEGTVRERPSASRHFFDYRPCMTPDPLRFKALYHSSLCISRLVLKLIDQASGTEVLSLHDGGEHFLRAAQYLCPESTSKDVLFPDHRDFSSLTVFVGSGSSGLQIMTRSGWENVRMNFGDLLIGVGTPLVQFCPHLKPLRHRVVGGDGGRLSATFFLEMEDGVVLPSRKERYRSFRDRLIRLSRQDPARA